MEAVKGIVCVTGGTGFIASMLIKRLLEEGYSVRTTVRPDPGNKRDLSFLTNLPGAAEKLKICSADLNDPDSFDAAIEGSKGVFHVATPVDFEYKEPEEIITERAINGTLGILKACLKSKTVKRVVYTSSVATVVHNGQDSDMMDENFWSDVDFIRENETPSFRSYSISKTLTERAALDFGAEHGLDVVTVIPSLVVGPFICPKFPGSVRSSLALVFGNHSEYSFLLNTSLVHVDDVTRAHIFVFEYPDAKGRYNCSSNTVSLQKLSKFLGGRYPQFSIPTLESLAEIKGRKNPGVSSKKLLDTGFKYNYGVEEMYDDAINRCKERGYL
ncbi:Vestitone reductase [Hibiscus syriacus]|uniref:Vestitone reductase n=1 Tax=Hibiscus syriacus TaxID=106335 RepID=A0A6A3C1B4_HIBSY|nr:vestitone reductase-like [Hibiscus syriacus]KAE8721418.1 Vestitone reductase [Hibiscus syriacus]